jgi:hypothetical protein
VRRIDIGETGGASQVGQLQESLGDLQDLAIRIGAGDVQRDDVLWRLRSYFHVVGVVIDEFQREPSRDQKTQEAVILLREIQSLVNDLIQELADEIPENLPQDESSEPRVLSSRTAGISPLVSFPGRRPINFDD